MGDRDSCSSPLLSLHTINSGILLKTLMLAGVEKAVCLFPIHFSCQLELLHEPYKQFYYPTLNQMYGKSSSGVLRYHSSNTFRI